MFETPCCFLLLPLAFLVSSLEREARKWSNPCLLTRERKRLRGNKIYKKCLLRLRRRKDRARIGRGKMV